MKKFLILALLLFSNAASAQLAGGMFPGPGIVHSTGGGAFSGPGDVVASASMWWGLRAYNAAYASANGNIADVVDTATGLASCTIKAATNGNADLTSNLCVGNTVSVTTFCTVTHATGCNVSKLYDQSGNTNCTTACDATQAILANQPTLTLNCSGSFPCMTFAGSQSLLTPNISPTISQVFSISTVAEKTGSFSIQEAILISSSGAPSGIYFSSTSGNVFIYAGFVSADVPAANSVLHSFEAVYNSTTSILMVDGVDTTGLSVSSGSLGGGNGLTFGNGNGALTGIMMEAGVWPVGFTGTQRTNMCHNQFIYWSTVTSC